MTQDEIIEMAEQANLDREPPDEYCRVEYWTATFEDLEAYTKLVTEKALADHIADVSKMLVAKAWVDLEKFVDCKTKAAQRPWVGLTDEEIADYLGDEYHAMTESDDRFFRLGESAAKEKNG